MSENLKATKDTAQPIGQPRLIVRDRDGHVLRDEVAHNLVVTTGRNILVKFLAGDFTGHLSTIELGEGGTSVDVWTPVDPEASDDDVASPFSPRISKAISGIDYGEGTFPTSVDFSIIFEAHEVDEIVTEAAIKFDDGTMYARYTFPSVYLRQDRGYSLELIWTQLFA